MLEILRFIFSSFWIWLGTAVLLGIVAQAFAGTVSRALVLVFQRRG